MYISHLPIFYFLNMSISHLPIFYFPRSVSSVVQVGRLCMQWRSLSTHILHRWHLCKTAAVFCYIELLSHPFAQNHILFHRLVPPPPSTSSSFSSTIWSQRSKSQFNNSHYGVSIFTFIVFNSYFIWLSVHIIKL